jgi:acyl carrier protein phosphodiesterase
MRPGHVSVGGAVYVVARCARHALRLDILEGSFRRLIACYTYLGGRFWHFPEDPRVPIRTVACN